MNFTLHFLLTKYFQICPLYEKEISDSWVTEVTLTSQSWLLLDTWTWLYAQSSLTYSLAGRCLNLDVFSWLFSEQRLNRRAMTQQWQKRSFLRDQQTWLANQELDTTRANTDYTPILLYLILRLNITHLYFINERFYYFCYLEMERETNHPPQGRWYSILP